MHEAAEKINTNSLWSHDERITTATLRTKVTQFSTQHSQHWRLNRCKYLNDYIGVFQPSLWNGTLCSNFDSSQNPASPLPAS